MKIIVKMMLCFWLILVQSGPVWASDLLDRAFREISREVMEALPRDVHVRLMAISEIKGDDGRLSRYLTESLQSSSHFILVERGQLEHLIREQGFQMSDLVSPSDRMEPGRFKGVEGILFGHVIKASDNPLSARARVFLQMDDVQSAKILMAREFSSTVHSPHRDMFIILIIAVSVFLILFILVRRMRLKRGQTRHQNTWKSRKAMTADLDRVSEVIKKIPGSNETDSSSRKDIAEIDFELIRLKGQITAERWGEDMSRDSKKLASFDRKLAKSIQETRRAADKLMTAVQDNDPEEYSRLISSLKQKLDRVSSVIQQRN